MEEYLDIVDVNDDVVGKEERDSLKDKGLEHNIRVVNIFVFNPKGELLLPKRSMNRRIFPGCYDFSCGEYVVSGEGYYDAAVRGLKEELNISDAQPIEIIKLTPADGVSSFMKVYKLDYNQDIVSFDEDGIEALYWYDLDSVKKMISEDKTKFKADMPIIFDKINF
jgi:isopentenyl-diphosphate delta-isomerase